MRAVVIGSSGHAGSYTVPALVQAGYEVVSITRGTSKPYTASLKEWDDVRSVVADRRALEEAGICDLICYEKNQAEQLVTAALGHISSYIFIGTIWVYGYNVEVPVTESHPRNALDTYGKGKIDVTEYLLDIWNQRKFPSTILHIGHLVGKGWVPITPQGNFNKSVFEGIAAGRELLLPDRGTSTVHHVHSADVAQMVLACLERPDVAAGQVYHTTAMQNSVKNPILNMCRFKNY
jgi:nucleoside-diphosphate-sugar epimerase